MVRIRQLASAAAATLVLAACGGNARADDATGSNAAAMTPPAAPTVEALLALEQSAYDASKSRDAKFWDTFLWDKFVGYGVHGRLDKASATAEYTRADCEIRSFALSDAQMQPLGSDAALITHKTTMDGTCGGAAIPADRWVASVYIRDGGEWRGAFHAEAPIVDPGAAPAKPVGKAEASAQSEAKPADRDVGTDTLLALERDVWEAWRAHDAKKIGGLTARDISFINIFGTHFANKAEALKDWTGHGCDVKSVRVTDAAATMLSPTVGILRFNGGADGTCFGQKIGPIWGTSVYVKDGDAWKWAFGINLPAPPEGD